MPIAINGAGTGDLPATTGARKQTPPQLNPIQVCATTDSIERCAPNPYHQNEPSLAQMRSNLADAAAVIFIPGAGEGGYVAKEVAAAAAERGAMKWLGAAASGLSQKVRDPKGVGEFIATAGVGAVLDFAGRAISGHHGEACAPAQTPSPAPSPTATARRLP